MWPLLPTKIGRNVWPTIRFARNLAGVCGCCRNANPQYPGLAGVAAESVPTDKAVLYLEPGLAFGSGSHPTTRMCLEWVASYVLPDQTVLDFGCGSGILAVAAALLGARVVAVDYDDQAVQATRENAEFNQVSDRIAILSLTEFENRQQRWAGHFDVVVANILAAPIIDLAPFLRRWRARANWCCLEFWTVRLSRLLTAIRRSTSRR